MRALVVDDVAVNVDVFAGWMRAWGMSVETAPGGAQALELLDAAARRGTPFDIAVLDFQMPLMDGVVLGRTIRANETTSAISLVLATSAPHRGDEQRFQAAGFNAYMTKPFRAGALRSTLEAVIGAGPGWSADARMITVHTPVEPQAATRPVAPPPVRSVAASVVTPRTAGASAPGGRLQVRALLAEDNPVNQRLAIKMLERLGCAVDLAVEGAEAIEMTSRVAYDVIFMDMQMPNVDGLEATRRIRARDAGGDSLYIVAMTANAMEGDRARCLDAGMDDYVSKPISLATLSDALERSVSVCPARGR